MSNSISKTTLHLGDSLDVVSRLSSGSVDVIFADPPYGINNNAEGDLIHRFERALKPSRGRGDVIRRGNESSPEEARPIANDGSKEARSLLKSILPHLSRVLKKGGVLCCCSPGGVGTKSLAMCRWPLWVSKTPGLVLQQVVIWDKGPIGMGWRYRRSYETVIIASKGPKMNWYDDSDTIENIIRPGQYGIRKILPSSDQHPTEKPWELAAHFLHLHAKKGDIILDPFMGSGSTGVAALNLGMEFIGVDIDEKWYKRASERLRTESVGHPAGSGRVMQGLLHNTVEPPKYLKTKIHSDEP